MLQIAKNWLYIHVCIIMFNSRKKNDFFCCNWISWTSFVGNDVQIILHMYILCILLQEFYFWDDNICETAEEE